MEKNKIFSLEENEKIKLGTFINDLFIEYEHLYRLSICFNDSFLVEKGKKLEQRKLLTLSATFKYDDFYCLWFNGGVKTYEFENELLSASSSIFMMRDYSQVNFYLKLENKKITYQEFEEDVISKLDLQKEKLSNIFEEKTIINFCKLDLQKDINFFLGKSIMSKVYAVKLNNILPSKVQKQKLMKV
ncbi:hypothetical protein GW796_00295 [archaeon]|nr:hypothetical protein [archaeon]